MSRDTRFWRNVALIAIAHLVVLLALARASRTRTPDVPSIVWMNSAAIETAAAAPPPATPELQAPPPQPEQKEEPSGPTLARSEIHLPSPTPIATPTPTPKATATPTTPPKPLPKPTAKPTPKPTPKKTILAKATPKPSPKPEKDSKTKDKSGDAKKEMLARKDSAADKSVGDGPGNGSSQTSEFTWYRTMLHDRFHKAWEQPKSIVAGGAKMSTLVKIRIEKDGRVSKFTIIKPSGNVVVDESVAAIAQRVMQVDALPNGLSKGAFYEVKIDFELNAEK
jgi:TonB family protein